jgi:signal transduction histidine kinase
MFSLNMTNLCVIQIVLSIIIIMLLIVVLMRTQANKYVETFESNEINKKLTAILKQVKKQITT